MFIIVYVCAWQFKRHARASVNHACILYSDARASATKFTFPVDMNKMIFVIERT